VTVYLADASAWEQTRYSDMAAERLLALRARGQLAICAAVEAELLHSAHDHAEFVALRADYDGLLWLDTVPRAERRALDVLQGLARRGQHQGVGFADLLIAAAAEQHGATVLHYDRGFARIADLTGQPHEWIVPRS